MVFNREISVRHSDKNATCYPAELGDEEALVVQAAHMFEDGIGCCQVETVIRKRQRAICLDLPVAHLRKFGLEHVGSAQAHGSDLRLLRIAAFDHIGRRAEHI